MRLHKIISKLILWSPFFAFSQTVAIDVGHSLKSFGSISSYGETEFSYNQKLAFELAKTFQGFGHSVNLIGYDGNMVSLEERTRSAMSSNFLISIHHDSVQKQDITYFEVDGKKYPYTSKASGFGIFVSTKNPFFKTSLKCAKIVAQNLINNGFEPNFYHNQNIVGENKNLFFPKLPVYQYDNLVVLKTSSIPAILIEAGVIVNPTEAKKLQTTQFQKQFSNVVASSIKKCFF